MSNTWSSDAGVFPTPYGAALPLPPGIMLTSKGKRFGAALLEGLLAVVTLVIGWIIWSVIIWERGQTPAKSILGMRVVRLTTGRAANRAEMAMRELVGKWN